MNKKSFICIIAFIFIMHGLLLSQTVLIDEDFENVTIPNLPLDWTNCIHSDNANNDIVVNTATYIGTKIAHLNNGFVMNDVGESILDSSAFTALVTPQVSISNTMELTFLGASENSESICIGSMTDDNDYTTFSLIEEVSLNTSMAQYSVTIPNNGTYYLAFKHGNSSMDDNIYIDNIELTSPFSIDNHELEVSPYESTIHHYPNPVYGEATIEYSSKAIEKSSAVSIDIYNSKGQRVDRINGINGVATWYTYTHPNGIYFYQINNDYKATNILTVKHK